MDTHVGGLFDGRYRLERRVGHGGMADVYLAEDLSLGRQVAIKVLSDRYARDAGFVERFRREATAAAGLNHPNIVGIYDRGQANGSPYIAMEYIDGRTLKDEILARAPFNEEEAIALALQVASALQFAHRRGIVHRDIKPHNVMLGSDGRVKVTDFGIARAQNTSQMTEVGSIVGTAQYLSPEQARGVNVGPPSDLYSLGVVLYEMLTGAVPFEGSSPVEIALKHVNDQPQPVRRLNARVSPALEQVVMRALAKDPQHRYPSAEALAADLERVRGGGGVSQETQQATRVLAAVPAATQVLPHYEQTTVTRREEPPPPEEPPRRRRSLLPWLLALLLLAAAAAIGYVVWGELTGNTIRVPDVVGDTEDRARARLTNRGFQVTVQREASEANQEGRVISTDPSAREEAPEGSSVTMVVGLGPETETVPDLVGDDVNDAISELTDLGFRTNQRTVDDPNFDEGQVVATNPPAGTELAVGEQVVLQVASGDVEVPNVVGQPQADAERAIRRAGLAVGSVESADSSDVAEGNIISSDPSAGLVVDRDTEVSLVVSSGPPLVEVPDTRGSPEDDAVAEMQAANLTPEVRDVNTRDPDEDGLVRGQSIGPGREVAEGTTVILFVARFVEPPPDTGGGGGDTSGTGSG